ncbi:RNA polymerase I subunit RpI12 isoform X2 [Ptiloglossa arizonensis]|uniref:RNA polymerase I subunit RpI12 isoform X2 n=1 Tax=Ptiloglossa arizonensis TaxID=3350558 RepID=UPI003F9F1941
MEQNDETVSFISTPGFCSDCGSILPLLGDSGDVKCYACKRTWGPEAFGDMEDNEDDTEGPIVERKCPQCQNDKMSYATLQLRSADEGQTVFYTCTKCKYKETENS